MEEQLLIDNPKKNNFLIMLLSGLLLIACIVAGFLAWKTQKLVKEIQTIQVPLIPTATPNSISEVNITSIKSQGLITSPVEILGTIDRSWTWEGTFQIEIVDGNGESLNSFPVGVIFENDDDKVGEFSISIPFESTTESGFIVVHSDNPSGLPENEKTFKLPIIFSISKSYACTEEAKMCPDGSYVGRVGPNCEFSPCP